VAWGLPSKDYAGVGRIPRFHEQTHAVRHPATSCQKAPVPRKKGALATQQGAKRGKRRFNRQVQPMFTLSSMSAEFCRPGPLGLLTCQWPCIQNRPSRPAAFGRHCRPAPRASEGRITDLTAVPAIVPANRPKCPFATFETTRSKAESGGLPTIGGSPAYKRIADLKASRGRPLSAFRAGSHLVLERA